ncbi:MAG: family NAD(P)-dependent oxidoreductase [Rickettsiaceae bacterium]|jgi:NAD(P)-dependent dehydrogenase (short-subunit alcohol dehydrogenase family)|nr:family NAD(P)-dependent oxidoreductase [Rickettsiaceae bacterium]
MTKKLQGRIALITGASRGIGAAVAKRYAQEGAHVILVARTVSGLEETDDAIKAAGGEATLVPLNLLEYNKIDELGGIIAKRFGKLDILVGNAAILGLLSPASHITPSVFEKTIATNLTANFRLIRSFDLLLRQSEAGRAIFVTSDVSQAEAYWGLYAASKAGLEAFVKSYADELKNSKVRVNLVDPGVVRTKMREEAMPGENPLTLPAPEEITDIFVELASSGFEETGQIKAA